MIDKKNPPLVTVYVPSRNYGKYAEKAIKSVINQVYNNWELILIDEGSQDSTLSIFNYYKEKYDKKISVLSNDKPVGLQKIANNVLSLAKGKYMIRLDADDWLHEFALEVLVHKLENSPKAGIVFPNFFYTNEKGKVIGTESRQFNSKIDLSSQLPPHGACTMFETKALRIAGGYTESVNAQDGWDLWLKLYTKIGAIGVDLPLFYYRQHGTSLSRDNSRLLKARTRIIKEIGSQLSGDYKPVIVGIIPVKKSYPNFKNIPFYKINDKTILENALNSSYQSKYINEIIVSSSSDKVLNYAQELENNKKVSSHLRYKRQNEKKTRNIPIIDILKSSAKAYFDINNRYPDILIYLSLHSIKRNGEHIDKAIDMLKLSKSDSVVSVIEERDPVFKYNGYGLDLINPGRFKKLVYDNERLYRFNGSIIATWWDTIKENKLFGEKTTFIEMSVEDSFQVNEFDNKKIII